MAPLKQQVATIDLTASRPMYLIVDELIRYSHAAGLVIDDIDMHKPWGSYIRFEGAGADIFIEQFFPGLSPEEARLGLSGVSLSPKFLLVSPGEMLSWQYHDRRAERWAYVTEGAYYKSDTDDEGVLHHSKAGDVVQFQQGERHRLVGLAGSTYTLVAEIWQHTDPDQLSDEDDIVRLADKYQR